MLKSFESFANLFFSTTQKGKNVNREAIYIDGLVGDVSDGYHTFNELYDHRNVLFIKLCESLTRKYFIWKSKTHSDGTKIEGWFILGIGEEPGLQITYHLPLYLWDDTPFAITLEKAPAFDGHTSTDVLDRILALDVSNLNQRNVKDN